MGNKNIEKKFFPQSFYKIHTCVHTCVYVYICMYYVKSCNDFFECIVVCGSLYLDVKEEITNIYLEGLEAYP